MHIFRIDDYHDTRFSQKVLNQHGCFMVDGRGCEVEIISSHEAIIHLELENYQELVEEFRFYGEHIDTFYNERMEIVYKTSPVTLFELPIDAICPSQFCVDKDKLEAVGDFVNSNKDIIIPVCKIDDKYVSLDGHARLKLASLKGYERVICYEAKTFGTIKDFVDECHRQNVTKPGDILIYDHETFEKKWMEFCDSLFTGKQFSNNPLV